MDLKMSRKLSYTRVFNYLHYLCWHVTRDLLKSCFMKGLQIMSFPTRILTFASKNELSHFQKLAPEIKTPFFTYTSHQSELLRI